MESLEKEKKFTEVEVRIIMEQLLLALDFFQKKKVVHRDIKPENIIINPSSKLIKYIDFGFSCLKDGEHSSNCLGMNIGTPTYMAPEVIDAQLNNRKLSFEDWKKADMWSLGITIYTIIMQQNPYWKMFPIPDDPDLYNKFLEKIRKLSNVDNFDFSDMKNGWLRSEVLGEIGKFIQENPYNRRYIF